MEPVKSANGKGVMLRYIVQSVFAAIGLAVSVMAAIEFYDFINLWYGKFWSSVYLLSVIIFFVLLGALLEPKGPKP